MKKITTLCAALLISAFGIQSMAQINTYPYVEDFDSGAGGWTVTGTGSWALGSPAAPIINSASSGANAWATNLTGLYSGNEDGQVVSPVFDLSAATNPEVNIKIWWESEFSWDGAVLQSSIDGGTSWQNVGAVGDPNNWYTDNTINGSPGGSSEGWTGRNGTGSTGGSNGWVNARHSLANLSTQTSVTFRMAFGSDGSVNDEGFAFDDFSILEITCPQPTALSAGALPTSATLSWTESGTGTTWDVEWGTTGFTQGTGTMITGTTTNPQSLTGLTAITSYDFYVRTDCGGGDLSSWSGPFNFTTPCAAVATPFLDDVESFTATTALANLVNCWNTSATTGYDWNVDGSGSTPSGGTGPSGAYSGVNYFYTEASGAAIGAVAELTSPLIDASTLTNPVLEFRYHMFGTQMGNLYIDIFDGASWIIADSINGQQQTLQADTFLIKRVYSPSLAGMTRVRFRAVSNGSFQGDISLDDISIIEGPSCPEPTFLSATNITSVTADLGWIENGSATTWNIEYDTTGFAQGTGNLISGTTTNPHSLSGLTPNTIYNYYVQADCGGGDSSTWSGPFSFTTLCADYQAPYFEGFEANGLACWNITGTPYNWRQNSGTTGSFGTGPNGASSGTEYMYTEANFGSTGDTTRFESPNISLTGVVNSHLQFDYHMFGADIDTLYIQIDNGAGFVTLDSIAGEQQTANGDAWLTKAIDLSAYDGAASIQLAFVARRGGGISGDVSIDNIRVAEVCAEPSLGVATNLSSSSAEIGWTTSGSAASSWSIEYGPTGFVQGTGNIINGTTFNPHPLAGLTDGTDYDFYIISNCALGERSPWAGPFNFTTFVTGVDENSANNGVSIYPNPNNGIFNLDVTAKNVTVKVMNIQGQTILVKNILTNNAKIDLSDNAKGIYFVTVTSDKGVSIHKVIVQ